MSMSALLGLEGTGNTRDLGGYRTGDGRVVRAGLVFRSDSLGALTTADSVVLFEDRMIRTVVDFRGQDEISESGASRLPATASLVHLPLTDESGSALSLAFTQALEGRGAGDLEELLGEGRGEQIVLDSARTFPSRPDTRRAFATVLRLLADPDRVPLLFNCRAGKDRTGFMSAVILRTLGVPEETVIEDYLFSNDCLRERYRSVLETFAAHQIDPALMTPLMEQRAETMRVFLDEVSSRHGSVESDVVDALGVPAETLALLRSTYLVDAS